MRNGATNPDDTGISSHGCRFPLQATLRPSCSRGRQRDTHHQQRKRKRVRKQRGSRERESNVYGRKYQASYTRYKYIYFRAMTLDGTRALFSLTSSRVVNKGARDRFCLPTHSERGREGGRGSLYPRLSLAVGAECSLTSCPHCVHERGYTAPSHSLISSIFAYSLSLSLSLPSSPLSFAGSVCLSERMRQRERESEGRGRQTLQLSVQEERRE